MDGIEGMKWLLTILWIVLIAASMFLYVFIWFLQPLVGTLLTFVLIVVAVAVFA